MLKMNTGNILIYLNVYYILKNLKERMSFCLNCFNEYYKYWSRLEEFGEKDTEGTALGDCIAKEKAKGFNYKEAYAHCASRVVVKPQGGTNPVVMEEDDIQKDDLLVEPVSFGQAVSIDFDDTLSTKEGQDMAKGLLDKGIELHIVTRRNQDDSGEVYKVADELGIPHDKIHFTNGELKWKTIKALGITKHIDNNQKEIDAIKENKIVWVNTHPYWSEEYRELQSLELDQGLLQLANNEKDSVFWQSLSNHSILRWFRILVCLCHVANLQICYRTNNLYVVP